MDQARDVDRAKGGSLSTRSALLFIAAVALMALPALTLGSVTVARVTGLYELAAATPYFHPSRALLLYLAAPVAVISAFVLYLLPGSLIVLAMGQARRIETLLLFSFGVSLGLSLLLSTAGKLLFGLPLTPPAFLALWLGASALAALALLVRTRRGVVLAWPLARQSDRRRLAWVLGMVFIGTALLLPKIFWESFNLDGIEAFEYGRSLTWGFLPSWEVSRDAFGFYQNFWLFSIPNHWFTTLLGPVEAAARLPFLLYVALLFPALILLIELGSPGRLTAIPEALLWLGLALYSVVQAYSTNYEPFYADLAEMAATDSLWVLVFLAACYCLWTGRWVWSAAFALMTYFAGPAGLLLLGLLAVFIFLAKPPQRWQQLRVLGCVIVACVGIGLLYEHLYVPLVLGETASQFSSLNLVRRLYPPTFTEAVRFNALLFTTGILPALSLFLVRRRDPLSWVMAGVSLGYFGVLYLQAWTSLHQFTPVMVLPLVVFWRLYLNWQPPVQRWALPALAVATAVSLALSLPQHWQVNLAVREFGRATEYRVGDYAEDYETAAAGAESLGALLPGGYRLEYPDQPWGMDSFSWIYYATREKPPGTPVNYVVQDSSQPAPTGFTQVSDQGGIAVYVRDFAHWERHREQDIPRVVASPLYEPMLRNTYQFFREFSEAAR